MNISAFLKRTNKTAVTISALALVAAMVASFSLFAHAANPDSATPDISYNFPVNAGSHCTDASLDPSQGGTFNWTASITNNGRPVQIMTAAFTSPTAGCAATDSNNDNAGWTMAGKTDYATGESGQTTLAYDTSAQNCGRVQIDAGAVDTDRQSQVFFGIVINYGHDCPTTPTPTPTPVPTPTPTPVPTPTPTPVPLVCAPDNQTVNVGQTANFVATGSNGQYSWYAPGANMANGSGSTFTAQYANPGNYTVTVTSIDGSATCNVSVLTPEVQTSSVNLVLNKRAFNQTQNVDATTVVANPGDVIVYTLTVQNTGNATATNYVFQDDISDVLQLSVIQSLGGATISPTAILNWPALNIPANSTVQKTFSVKVNVTFVATVDNVMTNTFGNTVNVNVSKPVVAGVFYAPKTGAGTDIVLLLSFMSVLAFAGYRKRETLVLAFQKLV